MAKQGWIDFSDTHCDGYVVVASVLREGRLVMDRARLESLRATLERLIERLVPSAAYATKIVPHHETVEIYCVFEKEADAQRVADAVRAQPASQYPGWASQWSFLLDGQLLWRSKPH
jgi:hypothetical protein